MTATLRTAILVLVCISFFALNANATVYTINDNWIDWPGYDSGVASDEIGTPKLDHMDVTIIDGYLKQIDVVLHDSTTMQQFNSLFINTAYDGGNWDSWTYFVHAGGSSNTGHTVGTVPGDGLYNVSSNYTYTLVDNTNRQGNPNGIDAGSLSLVDSAFAPNHSGYTLTYDFTTLNAFNGMGLTMDGGFYLAFAPFCANDVMGGGEPVPEPATLVLMGFGIVALYFWRKRQVNS